MFGQAQLSQTLPHERYRAPGEVPTPNSHTALWEMTAGSMSSERILIIEDESVVALDLRQRLEHLGYQVVGHATRGETGIELALDTKPDLIMMDIKLRGALDGIEAAQRIREAIDIPIVFLTAFADQETIRRAAHTGPFGYMLKPFDEQLLTINIEVALYKHRMEQALRASEERYELAIRGANDGIWDWDLRNNRLYFSPRWKEMLGYSDGEVGESLADWLRLAHPDDRDGLRTAMEDHLQGLVPHLQIEHRMVKKDGETIWVLTRGLATSDRSGNPTRMSGSQTDVTERKRMEEQLLHDAFHDTLTGLPNRALLMDRLERAMERGRRFPDDRFALMFLDLDRFKMVNDSVGHTAGDEFLVQISRRLSRLMRSTDTTARMGGDEFVILLEGVVDLQDVRVVAERVLEALKVPVDVAGQKIIPSASIGIVFGEPYYERAADMLRDADIAMYRAKERGKACYEVFEPGLRKRLLVSLEMETLMRQSLDKMNSGSGPAEFELHYQPIITLEDKRIIGFEALLRWHPKDYPPLSPVSFVPVAEESGLIIPLGEWILNEACRQMKEWQARFPSQPAQFVSVNISGRQFSHPDLLPQIKKALQYSGLQPASLRLELTESYLMENTIKARVLLEELQAMGVLVCIDDFGSGYSSLSYLHRFPVHTIKIDRAFIHHMQNGARSLDIVQTIIQLARDLQLDAIAEGVETEEQLQQLRNFQCRYAQGYLFSKPQPAQGISELLEKAGNNEAA